VRIGARLGLEDVELDDLGWAALLHDLGKLGIPKSILDQAGPLSHAQWDLIHTHPIVGSEMLLAISPLLETIAAGVRSHHERWDGVGYPDGLVGASVPRIGRIIAVPDAFDAMTSPRPYRKRALTSGEALTLIRSASGSQFDPTVVDAFVPVAHDAGLIPRVRPARRSAPGDQP
jgi:HD-GYP domain-containing protein (c-di-GMP phosphodiesterase class II)